MPFNYREPAVTQEDIDEAAKASGPREVAPKGKYKVRLHSMKGRLYMSKKNNNQEQDLLSMFFINLEGNFKGAELTLFRVKGDPATSTGKREMITILKAAGLTDEEVRQVNWAVDRDNAVDERGNLAAAFVKSDGSTVAVEGLEFIAFVDVEESDKGYKKNVIKGLAIAPKATDDLPF